MDDKARQHIVSAFIVIVLVVCVFSPFINFPIKHGSAAWWDTDWGYYKTCYVSNKIDDYQMKILIDFNANVGGNVSLEGNGGQTDFEDIRFVYNNATELPYWIENVTASTQATVWVNNSGNYSSFELFYGNAGASNNSDGDSTFDFFDDFNDASINWTNKWESTDQSNYAESGGELICSGRPSTTSEFIVTQKNYSEHGRYRFKVRSEGADVYLYYVYIHDDNTSYNGYTNGNCFMNPHDASQLRIGYHDSGDTEILNSGNAWTPTNYHLADFKVFDADVDLKVYQYSDLVVKASTVASNATFGSDRYFSILPYEVGRDDYYDWVTIGKYHLPNPNWVSFGSEQAAPNVNPVNSNPVPANGSTGNSLNPLLNITVNDADGHTMNQTFRTNQSGTWVDIAWNNGTGNATLSNSTSVFTVYGTEYWWSSNLSDGNGGWGNNTYSFTTANHHSSPTGLTATNSTTDSIDLNWTRGYFSNSTEYYGGDAEYQFAFHDATRHSAWYVNNVTYVVYAGDDGDPYIIEYNHTTALWSAAYKVGTNPLTDDNHGNPAIAINNTGYIYVFYGSHSSSLRLNISTNPYDITAWDASSSIGTGNTYPHPVLLDNGSIIIVYRYEATAGSDFPISYRTQWENWGTRHDIVDFTSSNALYVFDAILNSDGTKIYFDWVWYDYSIAIRRNVYCAYLDLTDFKLYNVSGTDLGVQISEAEANANCIAYDSSSIQTNVLWMNLDSNDYPHVLFNYYNNTFQFIRWTGSEWTTPEFITDTDDAWNTCPFILNSDTSITAYLVTNGTKEGIADRGGDIEKWSWDGTTWTLDTYVINDTDYTYPMVHSTIPFNNSDEMEVVFSEHNDSWSQQLKMFAYGDGGFVRDNWETIYTHVRYSTSNNLTTYTDGNQAYNDTGISYILTGLSNGTTYYFRAWSFGVTTGWNITGSDTVSLATTSLPIVDTGIHSIPRVNPSGITDVSNTTANATMTITNGYNCSYGVWYGTTFPVNEDNADGNISSAGSENNTEDGVLTSSITGLTAGQLYYTTAWVSNPSGFYNSSHYNFSFANYSYNVNGSGWHYITFPASIWDNNQSVYDAKDGDDRIVIETFLNISNILDDVEWIWHYGETITSWYNYRDPGFNDLTNLTYNEEYYFEFFNATNISFLFDRWTSTPLVQGYPQTYPKELFDYNSSLNANNTVINFLQQGGIWDDLNLIFRVSPPASWSKARHAIGFPQTLTEITYNTDYGFYILNYSVNLNFIYDKANANSTFLTRPDPATNLTLNYNTTNAVITWDKNAAANNTIITMKLNSYSTSPTDGEIIYNDTGETYTDSYEDYGNRYYTAWSYIRWSYNPVLWMTSSGSASANTTYVVDPPYNGASVYHTDTNYLNITWSRGNRSDREIVVTRNDTYATSATQPGNWIRQNSTNLYWNDTESTSRYYTIWSYNVTNTTYSIVGLNIPWGAIAMQTFNESNVSQAIVFDVLITNQEGTQTYEATNISNIWYIDLLDIPFGENVIFQVSATNGEYYYRVYHYSLSVNNFYNLTFYLPPYITETPGVPGQSGNTTSPNLYYIRVIDDFERAVEDATVEFRRYFSETDTFENVSILLTDGAGYVNLYLVPNVLYKVFINKSGYNLEISDYIPDPLFYGAFYPKIFRIELADVAEYTIWTNLVWDIDPDVFDIYSNSTTFYFNISSSDDQLEWFSLEVMIFNSTSDSWTTLYSSTTTTTSGGSLSYTVNTTGRYGVVCKFKKTDFSTHTFGVLHSEDKYVFTLWGFLSDIGDELDTNLNLILGASPVFVGTVVVAYTALFAILVVMFILFTFSPKFAGFGAMAVGIILGALKEPLGIIGDDVINYTVVGIIIILGLITLFVLRKSD